jgi:hypothetical protein
MFEYSKFKALEHTPSYRHHKLKTKPSMRGACKCRKVAGMRLKVGRIDLFHDLERRSRSVSSFHLPIIRQDPSTFEPRLIR